MGRNWTKEEEDFLMDNVKLGRVVVEDVKGKRTDVFNIKKKLFEKKYPDLEIKIVKG